MINKIIFDAFKTDRINWFKENNYSINSLWANPYKGEIGFIACYHGNKNVPTRDVSTALYSIDFNRSNHYGVRLPNHYAKADRHIEKPCRTSNFYEVLYSNIKLYEAPPFMFQDLAIHFKPYSIKDCAYTFAQFLQWDYHGVVSIRDIDTKYNLLTLDIDADLVPITNYFTVVNLPSTPDLEFTFKRIDKNKQLVGDCLTCTYQLTNVRTTIFDEVCSDKDDKHKPVWEMTDSTEKPHILYECDRHACYDKCSMNCYHTTDITHAKNFEYENGTWVERHSYPEVEV